MRIFVAIEIPKNLKEKLAKIQNQLQSLPIKASWVDPSVFHLTVEFLGEVEETKIKPLKSLLAKACGQMPAFSLQLSQLILIPTVEHPKVFAVGVGSDLKSFYCLKRAIRENIAPLGFSFEEEKAPHLTLGRIKTPPKTPLRRLKLHSNEIRLPKEMIDVRSIQLCKSELTATGPIHTNLFTASLKN